MWDWEALLLSVSSGNLFLSHCGCKGTSHAALGGVKGRLCGTSWPEVVYEGKDWYLMSPVCHCA